MDLFDSPDDGDGLLQRYSQPPVRAFLVPLLTRRGAAFLMSMGVSLRRVSDLETDEQL